MTLPTDGFNVSSVTYSVGTSNGLLVSITIGTNTSGKQIAADELIPYLETALDDLRTAYDGWTSNTVSYIERQHFGNLQGSV